MQALEGVPAVVLLIVSVVFAAAWLFLPFKLVSLLKRILETLQEIERNTRSGSAGSESSRTRRSDLSL